MKSLLCTALAFALAAPAVSAATAPAARPALREYDVLRSFPAGRLSALSAGDMPDAKGLTGSNRAHGSWVESGPQRGSCRAVIAAVVAGDARQERRRRLARRRGRLAPANAPTVASNPSPKANGKISSAFDANVETAYFFLRNSAAPCS